VIATLALAYAADGESLGCKDVRIFSQDKDCAQLVRPCVRQSVESKGQSQLLDVAGVTARFGVIPEYMPLYQALVGDTGDNIPGVLGIGSKTAAELVNRSFGSFERLKVLALEWLEKETKNAKPKAIVLALGKALTATVSTEKLQTWLELVTLRTDAKIDPLALLQKRAAKLIDDGGDADDSAFLGNDEEESVDWDAVAEQTAEQQEQARLADELISGPRGVTELRVVPGEGVDAGADAALDAIGIEQKPKERREWQPTQEEKDRAARLTGAKPSTSAAPSATAAGSSDTVSAAGPSITPAPAAAVAASSKASPEPTPSAYPPGPREPPQPSPPPSSSNGSDRSASPSAPKTPASPVPATASQTRKPQQDPDEIPIVSAEIVRVPAPTWELGLQPASAGEAALIAKRLFNSKFYPGVGNDRGLFAVLMLGRELGMGAMAAVESFHIVQGRPFAKATTLKALAERDPNCEWIMITHADENSATIKTKHRRIPEILEYTYTRDRAEQAGYFTGQNKHNWITKTQEMLEARVTSKAVRRWYPGCVLGMHSEEEAQDG
jgi:5'-3' exonuclease